VDRLMDGMMVSEFERGGGKRDCIRRESVDEGERSK
jgi:hypothetical protein